MEKGKLSNSVILFFKLRSVPFIRENAKIISQFLITAFFIGMAIWFIKHERAELSDVKKLIVTPDWFWIIIGIVITGIYILLQGLMYVASFASVNNRVSIGDAVTLFLKRNFISVFLPAGGISSLAFFSETIKKKGTKETQIHFASSVYAFVGILSVVLVAIPAFMYALAEESAVGLGEWVALTALVLLNVLLFLFYRSIAEKGLLYRGMIKIIPSAQVFMDDLSTNKINRKKFLLTVFYSLLIEFSGIAHLYIAMLALHLHPSLFAAIMGYIISVIFLIVSPFLRGLGAIEVTMTYMLIRFGFENVSAIAITFLFRVFEFWLPFFSGVVTFLIGVKNILLRIIPSAFLLFLGIVNIISVLTPSSKARLSVLKDFLPIEAIHASNYLVMIAGLFSLVTAAFMLKGLRTAWWFAVSLAAISFIGHLTKAIDYEEATVALIVLLILISTRKEYFIKNNPRLRVIGIETSLLSFAAVVIYGTVGFFFLDKKHFDIDFSLLQSIRYTIQNYFFIGSADLIPVDLFAKHFLLSINISGLISIAFLIYTLIYPHTVLNKIAEEENKLANELVNQHGNSALDYFKTYSDKSIFIAENKNAFIAYRVKGNYAVALETPVAATDEDFKKCISEFDKYCFNSGLKSIYYRVPETALTVFQSLAKKKLFLGQEAVVDLTTFSMEGGSKKSLRNGIKKITDKGFKSTTHLPPIKDGLLQKLKSVSDEWLTSTERTEIIFSQGMFVWEELKQQTILTVENSEEKIIAFINIIPDYKKGEGTYDLIRKTNDAPNGIMDFILIELFRYLKSQNYQAINLGFAPMSGLDEATNFPERSMKFAYEKIKSFSHYKGLRDFKEKFSPSWSNSYLIYSHDYDLLQAPVILTRVIKP